MRFRDSVQAEKAGLQLAPMIDIVFLLLIFFIVTWSYARFETELDISVPAAEEGESTKRNAFEIIVNVREDGTIVVNNAELTQDELVAKLMRISEVSRDQAVILRGDGKTDYSYIVNVLDACREANIWNVKFATTRPQPSES